MRIILIIFTSAGLLNRSLAQAFYFGADLSYVNEMEDCGAVYKVNGTPTDPTRYLKTMS
jgi:arabinogalactan endo-1,4-beta-galactosidase